MAEIAASCGVRIILDPGSRRATPRHPPVNKQPSYLLKIRSWRVLGLPWLHP